MSDNKKQQFPRTSLACCWTSFSCTSSTCAAAKTHSITFTVVQNIMNWCTLLSHWELSNGIKRVRQKVSRSLRDLSVSLPSFSFLYIYIYSSVGCAACPSVTTSPTEFSFENLVFWNLFEFLVAEINSKNQFKLPHSESKSYIIKSNKSSRSFQQHQRTIPNPPKFSATNLN
jgi:hypothetical protein